MRRIQVYYCGVESYNENCKDVFIKNNYNPVAIKRQINRKIYVKLKTIQLYRTSDGHGLLSDNTFIPEDISELFWMTTIENPDHIILTIQKNEFGLPRRIQVLKTDTIESILYFLSSLRDMSVSFAIFDENGKRLRPENTVKDCNLIDNSIVKVWNENDLHVNLNICSILDKTERITNRYPICTKVSDIKQDLINRLRLTQSIILFSELSYFDNEKLLIDYFIQNNDIIYYFKLLKRDEIISCEVLKERDFSKLFKGRIAMTNEDLVLTRYKKKDLKSKYFRYEITSLLLLSNSNINRFVTLISLHDEKNYFLIATEYLSRGSLKSLYQKQWVPEDEIITYFIQVCEAVDYMHGIKLIHRNIKCSSILLCEDGNVKLCNFHKAKYLDNVTMQQFEEGVPGSIIEDDIWWVSPEILNCEPYGSKADIWSLGAAMIEILTRKHPHYPLNSCQARNLIKERKLIQYDRNLSSRLSQIIDKCICADSNNRLDAYGVKRELEALNSY